MICADVPSEKGMCVAGLLGDTNGALAPNEVWVLSVDVRLLNVDERSDHLLTYQRKGRTCGGTCIDHSPWLDF